ncbi:ABC-F family ATP-binding cassette domain-containing protein [Kitasatospora sp. MBT63]|uniref:ABC-F family ATP-binding cassette domain-containing protein n=1 Tax=Kitasatospora sp. MBT63 TaxID=1444768 RepID=UPI00053B1FF2|nr:ABC-F family ATP-binding cassette domain-containing protein [Kitasatospora sp. MBT63]
MSMANTSVVCSELTFAWPDGTPVLDDFSLVVGSGRTGLIGVNGSGKSTLLRLMAGELTPASGSVKVTGELGYLPQTVVLDAEVRVEEQLGIAGIRRALNAIEAGDTREELFTVVGDDWDVEERARATLDRLGLTHVPLERRIGELSGGESVLLCLAAQFLRRPDVLFLDEPTNNLDLEARRRLYDAVAAWKGSMVIVSHDRELLDLVDQIADLRDGEVRWFGGNFAEYERVLAVEQEAAERMVRVAESDVRRQKRELADARIKLDRRVRYGNKMYETKREPKVVMKERKRQAQVAAGKHRNMHLERLEDAKDRLTEAEEAVRDDREIRVDLPETSVPAGKTVLTLSEVELRYGTRAHLEVRGAERIALVGRNGAGKSTLLRTITGELPAVAGEVKVGVPMRYLPQRLDLLDERLTVAQNVGRFAPEATDNAIRARLARFLFRGRRADQEVGTLSGGERFRATLAALLLAEPPPQLLLLDEPTNNLDLASVRQLTQALRAYQGALIVVSHDVSFLRDLGITRWIRVDGDTSDIDPL